MSIEVQNPDWKPAVDQGEFEMVVITERKCRELKLRLHQDGKLCGVLRTDDETEPVQVAYPTEEAVCRFIASMKPHNVRICGADGEDLGMLRQAVMLARHEAPDPGRMH